METIKNENEAFKISGNWAADCKKLQKNYAQLTYSDLKCEKGQENELLARIETRLNKKRLEVINVIKQAQTNKY